MLYTILFLSLPLLYFLSSPIWNRLRLLLTPRGIKGIPGLSSSVPLWGDIPLMGKMIGDHDSFSYFFDWISGELGPIGQVRAGFFQKWVLSLPPTSNQ
jgi:hypothetical protein